MKTDWIRKLPQHETLPLGYKKFLTRFKSYDEFMEAYRQLYRDCLFFSVDFPINSRGKVNTKDVVELMIEFAKLEIEYS